MAEESKDLLIGSEGFALPLSLVTSTQAILARKRSGKSYTASVEAEELLSAAQQVVVFDPTGAWWGLRSSADGEGAGYPVVVFGGDHEDAPLDFRAGKALATAVVEHGFSAIFDIGNLVTDEQVQFVMDFCSELLRINRMAIHVFMDEADTFAPQMTVGSLQKKCLQVVSRLVKQGGVRGVGFTMITQRPASLNKDILTQVDILTVLRMSHPLDVKAAVDWIKSEVSVEFAEQVQAALPSLPVGTAFVCSAPLTLGERVEIRARQTFNSGATPKPGERKAEPKVLAKIDLEKLGQDIAASVQRARENSVEGLQDEVRRLREQLSAKGAGDMGMSEDVAAMERELEELRPLTVEIAELRAFRSNVGAQIENFAQVVESLSFRLNELRDAALGTTTVASGVALPEVASQKAVARAQTVKLPSPAPVTQGESSLSGPSQRILAALARLKAIRVEQPDRQLVCLFAGYTNLNSKGFANAIGSLRSAGFIDYPSPGTISLTAQGASQVQRQEPIRSNVELHGLIFAAIGGAGERILEPLLASYPKSLAREAVAAKAGYANLNSKGFANAIGRMRSMGFIDYPESGRIVATSLCFLGGSR